MGPGPSELWNSIAPQWMLELPEGLHDFIYTLYKCFIYDDRYMMYIKGLGNTLTLTFFSQPNGVLYYPGGGSIECGCINPLWP